MRRYSYIIVLLIGILFLSGCSKNSITIDSFKDVMDEKSCSISNLNEAFSLKEDESVLYADCKDYQFQFFKVNEDMAKDTFKMNKDAIKSLKEKNFIEYYNEGNNYEIYEVTTDDSYNYISRIDNTFLYVSTDKKYKDAVKDIIDKLGY